MEAEAAEVPWSWNIAPCHFGMAAHLTQKARHLKIVQLNREEAAEFVGLPPQTSPRELVRKQRPLERDQPLESMLVELE